MISRIASILILLAFSSSAFASAKVTLMIYVDMSGSMGGHRRDLANMAEVITENLEMKCGTYEVAVSNLTYDDIQGGGELVQAGEGPAFITESTANGKDLLARRIKYDNNQASFAGTTVYARGTHEKTYTSALETIESHLMQSPSGLNSDGTVGILILSDAAPYYESLNPEQASQAMPQLVAGRPWMFGALGAAPSCMDFPTFPPDAPPSRARQSQDNWLSQFSRMNDGYMWNMCAEESFEQSVMDYMIMLMDKAQCMPMV